MVDRAARLAREFSLTSWFEPAARNGANPSRPERRRAFIVPLNFLEIPNRRRKMIGRRCPLISCAL